MSRLKSATLLSPQPAARVGPVRAADENVVVEIPHPCLTRPGITDHPVRVAVAVKVDYCSPGPRLSWRRGRCGTSLRAVSPARVEIGKGKTVANSAPDDHLTAGPDCCVIGSGRGRVDGAGGRPTIRGGIVSPPANTPAAPDSHFAASPDCCVIGSGRGRVSGASGCPTVGGGTVFPAGVEIGAAGWIKSAPYDQFTAAPHCRVTGSGNGRVDGAGGHPIIRDRIVSPSRVVGKAAPDDHLIAGPNCCVKVSARGRVSSAGRCPTIRAGIVSPAGIRLAGVRIKAAPNDHLIASPHRRMLNSLLGRISGASSCPTIRSGIVSAAGVQITAKIVAAPNNHFSASPYRRVTPSGRGGISGASRGPSVGDRVVPPAAVKPSNWVVMKAAPDDHFAACPHCRVKVSGSGGVSGARSCPGIVSASA